MLIIRDEQMAVLARAANRPFVLEVAAGVREIFPAAWERLGEAGIHRAIEDGIARAAEYGIDRRGDVAEFISLMFDLDLQFDTDPAFSWAHEVLRDRTIAPGERLDRVDALAVERLGFRVDPPRP